jgi:hypothetical protein
VADRSADLESRVESLERRLREIAERLERLETSGHELGVGVAETPAAAIGSDALALGSSAGTLPLVGRTLVALGGGYLVRAITDAALLPPLGGVTLGLCYALLWLAMADRAAARGGETSASFHGLTAGLIAYPLLWETTTRFRLLHPAVALALLGAVFAATVLVARRHDLVLMAWVSALLALGTNAALLVATRHLLAADLSLLGMVVIVEWLALQERWRGLRWPVALVVDGAFLVTVWLVSRPEGLPDDYPPVAIAAVVAAALGLAAVYLASVAARTLGRGDKVAPFEVFQVATAVILGVGGAWRMLTAHGVPGTALGATTIFIGALCYSAAFAFVEQHKGHGRNFYFYSTTGGFFVLAGSAPILDRTPLAIGWCLLSLAGAWLGRRYDRMTLRFHAALYACAAVLVAGVLAPWRPSLGASGLVSLSLATTLAGYALMAGDRAGSGRWRERAPQTIVAALAAWTLGGVLSAGLAAVVPSAVADPGAAATLRTVVLSGMVLGLASAARRWTLPELGWLVYPLLAIGGFWLLSEDLPHGRPATIFLSLASYGGALIVAPRQSKRAE